MHSLFLSTAKRRIVELGRCLVRGWVLVLGWEVRAPLRSHPRRPRGS